MSTALPPLPCRATAADRAVVLTAAPATVLAARRADRPALHRWHVCGCGSSFNRSLRSLHRVGFARARPRCDQAERTLVACGTPGYAAAFRRRTDRAKQEACMHSRRSPFACASPVCGAAFFFHKGMLKRIFTVHLRMHPFGCERCGQAFWKNARGVV